MATPNVFQEAQERNKQDVNVAVASADPPAYTEERSVPLSVDTDGYLRVILSADSAVGGLYDYATSVQLQDDFVAGSTTSAAIGTLGWTFTNATVSKLEGEANHPGIIRRSTSAVSGTVATLFIYNSAQGFMAAGTSYDMTWLIRLNTNDANTTIRLGTHSMTITDPPGSGSYFEKLDGDTNWFIVTRNGGTQTRNDSGVAVSTNWVTLRLVRTANTSVAFYINGSLVGTNTTNLPAVSENPALTIVNSAAAAKTVDVDYFEITLSGLTR